MANPAELLHDLFKLWNSRRPNSTVADARRMATAEGFADHLRAMRYLSEIDELLIAMDADGRRVGQFRRRFNGWAAMVLSYNAGWSYQASAFDEGHLDTLESLIEPINHFLPGMPEREQSDLRALIDSVLDQLESDNELPADLKRHLYTVANHCRTCLDDQATFGDFAVRSAADRLIAEVMRAASAAGPASKWAQWFNAGWSNYGLPLAISAASSGVVEGVKAVAGG